MLRFLLIALIIAFQTSGADAQIIVNVIDGFTLEPVKQHTAYLSKNSPELKPLSESALMIKKPIQGVIVTVSSPGYLSGNISLSDSKKDVINLILQPGDSLLNAYKSKYDFYQSSGSKKKESEPTQTITPPASAKSVVTFPEEQYPSGNPVAEEAPKIDTNIMSDPEIPAEFPGGQIELRKFLMTHLRYPQRAVELGIQGKVFVRFLVSKNGEISNIYIVRGLNLLLDTECVRILKLMPNWNPGMLDGKAINTTFAMPIQFKLN